MVPARRGAPLVLPRSALRRRLHALVVPLPALRSPLRDALPAARRGRIRLTLPGLLGPRVRLAAIRRAPSAAATAHDAKADQPPEGRDAQGATGRAPAGTASAGMGTRTAAPGRTTPEDPGGRRRGPRRARGRGARPRRRAPTAV